MSLYEQWLKAAYDANGRSDSKLWSDYLPKEQAVYEDILGNKTELTETTVSEFSKKYGLPETYVCGFADGIKDALVNELDPETLESGSSLVLRIDFRKLYQKMIEYKARKLYSLSQWDTILSPEEREGLKYEATQGKVFVRESEKIGRNDLCPCGSGKKYKKCCGA
jgi:hypothetical protein